MTTLLLALFVGPLVGWAISLARVDRGGVLSSQALAVATIGGRDLNDVVTYTQDCSLAACLLLAHRDHADPALLRSVLRDAITQIDSVQRATRLRSALGREGWWRLGHLPTWPDMLLFASGLLDAEVIARLIIWRGDGGMTDLREMTARAIERFSSTVADADEAPLLSLFADELVRLGLLDADALDCDEGDPTSTQRDHDPATHD